MIAQIFPLIVLAIIAIISVVLLKYRPKIFLVLLGSFGACIVVVIIFLLWPHTPTFKDYVADTKNLRGSTVVYQLTTRNIDAAAPDNDSSVLTILKVSLAVTKAEIARTTMFKSCTKHQISCTKSPTWRPRSDFVNTNGPHFGEADLASQPSVLAAYHTIANEPATRCTSRDYTERVYAGSKLPPNRILVCASPASGYMSIEYLSGADSTYLL